MQVLIDSVSQPEHYFSLILLACKAQGIRAAEYCALPALEHGQFPVDVNFFLLGFEVDQSCVCIYDFAAAFPVF